MRTWRFSMFAAMWYAAILILMLPVATKAQAASCNSGVCDSLCSTWCFEIYETSDFWDANCPSCYCRQGCCFHFEGPPTCEFLCGSENYARCRAGSCDR
jgi:hypothetical protein